MNNTRRKALASALSLLRSALEIVQVEAIDERDAYDNLSEGAQDGERGQAISDAADALDSAEASVEEAIGYIEEAVGQ